MAKAFFPGVCAGPTFPGFTYAAESGSRAVSLILDTPSSSSRTLDHIYYNGGGHFLLPSPAPDSVRILARYADRPTSSSSTSSELPIAAVLTRNGKGKALLCSVHFEYPLSDPPARDALAKLADPPEKEEVERSEKAKIEWAREMLEMLGLKPPDRSKQENGTTVPDEDEDSALLLHPTHPSPIFVLPHPALPQLGSSSFASSSLSGTIRLGGRVSVMRMTSCGYQRLTGSAAGKADPTRTTWLISWLKDDGSLLYSSRKSRVSPSHHLRHPLLHHNLQTSTPSRRSSSFHHLPYPTPLAGHRCSTSTATGRS